MGKSATGADNGTAESLQSNDGSDPNTVDESASDGGKNTGDSGKNEPLNPAAGVEAGTRKRKRAGTGNDSEAGTDTGSARRATGQKTNKVGLTGDGQKLFATQLVGVHKMLGIMTGYGEIMEIEEAQAESMAAAITEVMAQYKIKPNPKIVAWANLAGIAAAVYAPKILIITALKKQARENPPEKNNNAPHDLHVVQTAGTMQFN